MRLISKVIFLLLIAIFCISCSKSYVRHLASDASLLVPHQTTKKDVMIYMGIPESQKDLGQGKEEWTYYQSKKSLLRKTPYVGKRLGHQDYDVVIIVFQNDIVASSTYRIYTEEEFSRLVEVQKNEPSVDQ